MSKHGDFLGRFAQYKLSEEQLKKLHFMLFEIMKDFKRTCEENDLTYMLSGGTLLGAIRHKGFIPWDDDVDFMMPRNDYDKLYDIYKDNDKYFIEDPATSACAHKMIKIMMKGTTYTEVGCDNPNYPSARNIFIDVFPIENMPKGKSLCRALRYKVAFHASNLICERKYKSPIIAKLCEQDKEMRKYYNYRYRVAALVRLLGSFDRHRKVAMALANYKKETGFKGIPFGVGYNNEKFEARILTETAEYEFNGEKFSGPKYYDEYLTNLYGADYMIPPPLEKRGSHAVAEFKID